ncbi:hypothetical protein ACWD4B_12130 [Streptomyces sp. NPDC002536]
MPVRTVFLSAVRRRLVAGCGIALAAALTLTGCTGDDKAPTGSATSPSASASAAPSPAPADTVTPSASPTTVPKAPASTKAAPTADSDGAAAPPAPKRTHGSTGSRGNATCEIRSNAGNCYKAGEFCRTGDVGASTHDAGGRLITCVSGSGRPRWH